MAKKQIKKSKVQKTIKKNVGFCEGYKREIASAFLGAGLTLFVMNVTSLLGVEGSYPSTLFNISVFSSVILVLVAVYRINN